MCFNFLLPSQKRRQYHILILKLLEDRFSPRTLSTLAAETLTHILEKQILKLSLLQTNNYG